MHAKVKRTVRWATTLTKVLGEDRHRIAWKRPPATKPPDPIEERSGRLACSCGTGSGTTPPEALEALQALRGSRDPHGPLGAAHPMDPVLGPAEPQGPRARCFPIARAVRGKVGRVLSCRTCSTQPAAWCGLWSTPTSASDHVNRRFSKRTRLLLSRPLRAPFVDGDPGVYASKAKTWAMVSLPRCSAPRPCSAWPATCTRPAAASPT